MTIPARGGLDEDRTVPCRNNDPELWYPKPGRAGNVAKALAVKLCGECPRREECLARALAFKDVEFGISGGLTAPERAALLKPAVPTPTGCPPRPVPPPRGHRQYAGWDTPGAPDRVIRVFDGARAVLDGEGSRPVVAARFGVSMARMSEAISVLRWCPDLEGDVVDGWVSWRVAAGYAQQVKQWELDREAREAAMGVAA